METIQKGKQTNKQTTCVPVTKVNKQTNKQAEVAHVEVWMQGVVQSCIACRVQYAMHQSMQKSFRDALEMLWRRHRVQYAGSYSDRISRPKKRDPKNVADPPVPPCKSETQKKTRSKVASQAWKTRHMKEYTTTSAPQGI